MTTVVLGVSGGIACYKAAELCRLLVKEGLGVVTVMTEAARQFVRPLTFEALTGRKVCTSLWDRQMPSGSSLPHIDLSRNAALLVVAPATADIIAKFHAGIADDLLSTLFLSFEGPRLVAPAMNTAMYRHPATRRNLATLREWGVHIVGPASGDLACGETGEGRMEEPAVILRACLDLLGRGPAPS